MGARILSDVAGGLIFSADNPLDFLHKIYRVLAITLKYRVIGWNTLFAAILLSRLDTLLSKSVFVTKFACANLALKTSAAKVLNSGVVIYLSWLWLLSLFSISVTLVL